MIHIVTFEYTVDNEVFTGILRLTASHYTAAFYKAEAYLIKSYGQNFLRIVEIN